MALGDRRRLAIDASKATLGDCFDGTIASKCLIEVPFESVAMVERILERWHFERWHFKTPKMKD